MESTNQETVNSLSRIAFIASAVAVSITTVVPSMVIINEIKVRRGEA